MKLRTTSSAIFLMLITAFVTSSAHGAAFDVSSGTRLPVFGASRFGESSFGLSETAGFTVTINSAPANLCSAASGSFTFTASQIVPGFECSVDGETMAACSSPYTFTGLADGSHTFTVRAVDTSAHPVSAPAGSTWTIDTLSPDTSILGYPADPTVEQDGTFSFSATEAGAVFECSIDNGTFGTCSSPYYLHGIVPGQHTFAVRATDPAGNIDLTPASHSWTVIPADSDIKVDDTYFQTIENAFSVLNENETLRVRGVELSSNIVFNRHITFNFKGGFDSGFTANNYSTVIHGSLLIEKGTVIIENITLAP